MLRQRIRSFPDAPELPVVEEPAVVGHGPAPANGRADGDGVRFGDAETVGEGVFLAEEGQPPAIGPAIRQELYFT